MVDALFRVKDHVFYLDFVVKCSHGLYFALRGNGDDGRPSCGQIKMAYSDLKSIESITVVKIFCIKQVILPAEPTGNQLSVSVHTENAIIDFVMYN